MGPAENRIRNRLAVEFNEAGIVELLDEALAEVQAEAKEAGRQEIIADAEAEGFKAGTTARGAFDSWYATLPDPLPWASTGGAAMAGYKQGFHDAVYHGAVADDEKDDQCESAEGCTKKQAGWSSFCSGHFYETY